MKSVVVQGILVAERVRSVQAVAHRPEQTTHRVDDLSGQPEQTPTPAEPTSESAAHPTPGEPTEVTRGHPGGVAERGAPVRGWGGRGGWDGRGKRCGSSGFGHGGRQRRRGIRQRGRGIQRRHGRGNQRPGGRHRDQSRPEITGELEPRRGRGGHPVDHHGVGRLHPVGGRAHRRQPLVANIVVHVGDNLLTDEIVGVIAVRLSRRHRGGGGQPFRPLRAGAVIHGDGRRRLGVDEIPQVVAQRLTPLRGGAQLGGERLRGVAVPLQQLHRRLAARTRPRHGQLGHLGALQPQRLGCHHARRPQLGAVAVERARRSRPSSPAYHSRTCAGCAVRSGCW
ncbi:hypothetical protein PICSAR222_02676 [Mycobacterium avium subsp. paratuberculosis]|nr:hypothetical protein PICSAR222_02676 [Mycobacterium avium subsp. paratuberculosis]